MRPVKTETAQTVSAVRKKPRRRNVLYSKKAAPYLFYGAIYHFVSRFLFVSDYQRVYHELSTDTAGRNYICRVFQLYRSS